MNSENIINATLNDNIEISCPIINAEEYHWYKDGEELFDENENILRLNSILWDEHGNYTCIGKNDAGSVEYTQKLIIWTIPQFISDNNSNENYYDNDDENENENENKSNSKNIEVKLGENVTLKCTPQGYPKPEVFKKN